jgi:hypothetical protein
MLASTLPNLLLSPMLPRASPPSASMPPREGPTPVGIVHRHDKVMFLCVLLKGRDMPLMRRDGEGGREVDVRARACMHACMRVRVLPHVFCVFHAREGRREGGRVGGKGGMGWEGRERVSTCVQGALIESVLKNSGMSPEPSSDPTTTKESGC